MNEEKHMINELASLLNSVPCGIGIFDIKTSLPIFLNEAYYRIVGYTHDEYKSIMANAVESLVLPPDKENARRSVELLLKNGKSSDCEYRIACGNGRIAWIRLNGSLLTYRQNQYAIASFTDITSEKEAHANMKLLAENASGSVTIFRVTNNVEELIYANDQFYELIGVSRERYNKNSVYLNRMLIDEANRDKVRAAIDQAMAEGKSGEVEHLLLRPDGKSLWLNRRYAAIKLDTPDSYLMISIVRDITEKKNIEIIEALEHHRYQLVIDELNAAVFEWNFQTGEFYKSTAYKNYAMSNISNEDILNNRGSLDVVHPDDIPLLLKFFVDSKSGVPRAEAVLRTRMCDGSFRWCRMIGHFFKDKHGAPTRTIGVVLDINDDRERELMMNSLINEIPGGVAVFKIADKPECQYYSDGFAKLSGRTREEIDELIRTDTLLKTVIAQTDRQFLAERVAEVDANDQTINIICRIVTKNGITKWINLSATRIREENGCPLYYCVCTIPSDEAKLYQNVVQDSAIGVLVAERQTRRCIYMNKALYNIYGISPQDISDDSKFTEIAADKMLLLTQDEINALSSDSFTEFHILHNGSVYLSIRGKALDWNGTDAYIIYVTDETAEHQHQMRLQELVNNIPGGVGIFEIYGGTVHQVYMNDSFYELISDAHESSDINKEMELLSGIHPDDIPVMKEAISSLASGTDRMAFNYRRKSHQNNYIWLHIAVKVVSRTSGKVTIYCCLTDVNDAMEAKEALEKSNAVMQMQYNQELERRKILEKGSFLRACVNLTRDEIISWSCIDDRFKRLPEKFDFQTAINFILSAVPMPQDVRNIADKMNRRNMLELFSAGITEDSIEYRRYQPDGALRWIRAVCNITEDIHIGDVISYIYFYDIDDQKKAQIASGCVVNEEIDYVLLYSIRDNAARIIHARENQVISLLGDTFKLTDILLTDIYHDVLAQDRDIVEEFLNTDYLREKLEQMPVVTITYRRQSPGESVRRKKARAFYLDETHDDIVIARRDITDLYEEEQAQKQALQAAADEAIQANQAKSDFLARMSHDMRTPMNGILGIARLMYDKTDINEIKDDLAQLEMSGQYLLRLINDTLDMSKIEAGKLDLHPELIDSPKVFKNIIVNAAIIAKERGVTLDIRVPDAGLWECPPVMADSARLEQIIMNVISNAVKFTPPGGTVTLIAESVAVTDKFVTDRYIIRDTGIGMSEDFIPHLFEPFSQEGRAGNGAGSTGLGMAIVKQLIEMMGGEISVKSKPNEGTEVTLLIHYQVYHDEGQRKPTPETDISALNGKRILLCEDHPLNARIARKMLTKSNMIVDHAENGKIGLEMFANSPIGYYDAVLMDIRMPEMDGLKASAAIRALNRTDAKVIPIVAVTANAYQEDITAAISAGMNEHLSKPIDPEKLHKLLFQLLIK